MRQLNQQHLPYRGEYKDFPHSEGNEKEPDEFEVFALAKRLGISEQEMRNMSFVSLVNILISSLDSGETEKMGTEQDVRRMFG